MRDKPDVKCLVCERPLKSVAAHLRIVHKMSVDEYKAWAKEHLNIEPDQIDLGWTLGKGGFKGGPTERAAEALKYRKEHNDPVNEQFETLSKAETANYKKRYNILFRQADFDPALEPGVRQIVMNEMIIERYQAYINAQTMKIRPGDSVKNANLGEAHRVIKELGVQNLALMNSMGLTREKKLAQKKHVETTPSRLVTAYTQELQRLTPEERKRLQEDEDDAVRRFLHNEASLLTLVPASAIEEDEDGESA